jgi:serine-type D-Ala-D-Ala carboxypeptidase/endopeptidase (penicillin-binding protein 4)
VRLASFLVRFNRAALASLVAGVWLAPHPVSAQSPGEDLQAKLKAWYRSAARSAPGKWGIAIADQQGEIIWSVKPDQEMIPASAVKLLTTGFARTVLGGEARRLTRVRAAGRLDEGTGEWIGRWVLELNGDPSLESPTGEGPSLDDLAIQLANQGVRRLSGPLQVVTASGPAQVWYPAAWSPYNKGSIYAPMVGPLTLHENIVWLAISPGPKVGSRAVLEATSPNGLDALVDVHATTGTGTRSQLSVSRMKDGGYLVTGRIGIGAVKARLASVASDPKAVLAAAWAQALQAAGIEWDRTPPTMTTEDEPTLVLAEVSSASFDSLATDINRRSVNIGAELLLQWAAGTQRGPELLTQHVQQVAGVAGGVHLFDGSGLSHQDRVTPATFIYYLARFPSTPAGRNFPRLLPGNGEGTLRDLASGFPGPGVVHAKTGTLSDVSSLVGYLGRRDGVLLISLMYNGSQAKTAKKAQWKLFRLLGADGIAIPADSTLDSEAEALGGGEVPGS